MDFTNSSSRLKANKIILVTLLIFATFQLSSFLKRANEQKIEVIGERVFDSKIFSNLTEIKISNENYRWSLLKRKEEWLLSNDMNKGVYLTENKRVRAIINSLNNFKITQVLDKKTSSLDKNEVELTLKTSQEEAFKLTATNFDDVKGTLFLTFGNDKYLYEVSAPTPKWPLLRPSQLILKNPIQNIKLGELSGLKVAQEKKVITELIKENDQWLVSLKGQQRPANEGRVSELISHLNKLKTEKILDSIEDELKKEALEKIKKKGTQFSLLINNKQIEFFILKKVPRKIQRQTGIKRGQVLSYLEGSPNIRVSSGTTKALFKRGLHYKDKIKNLVY